MPSARLAVAYSRRPLLLTAATLLIAAHRPPPPSGDLVLDAANPVVQVQISGVTLHLRVDLDRWDSIELNPSAAARLPARWEPGLPLDVGRVRLDNRVAPVVMHIAGRDVPGQISEHGRDCCAGTDGAIGPDLLPYATVRWTRADTPPPTGLLTIPLASDAGTGLTAAAEVSGLRLRFALAQDESIGTAAAGAVLARSWGGRWDGAPGRAKIVFGIFRPARAIAFTHPGRLAGFRFDRLVVRISDFGGDEPLPADPIEPGELVVTRQLGRQAARALLTIGADRLARCADITYDALAHTLALNCAFDMTL